MVTFSPVSMWPEEADVSLWAATLSRLTETHLRNKEVKKKPLTWFITSAFLLPVVQSMKRIGCARAQIT